MKILAPTPIQRWCYQCRRILYGMLVAVPTVLWQSVPFGHFHPFPTVATTAAIAVCTDRSYATVFGGLVGMVWGVYAVDSGWWRSLLLGLLGWWGSRLANRGWTAMLLTLVGTIAVGIVSAVPLWLHGECVDVSRALGQVGVTVVIALPIYGICRKLFVEKKG